MKIRITTIGDSAGVILPRELRALVTEHATRASRHP